MLPNQLQNLIFQFTKLPGIGPRQATRFAFYLLRNQEEISTLADTLKFVAKDITLCPNCFLPSYAKDSEGKPTTDSLCAICVSPKRDKNTICVVEKETDALNFEKTAQFNGHYFVLGGFIDPLNKESVGHERLTTLLEKINRPGPAFTQPALAANGDSAGKSDSVRLEIILALTPRREGDFTSLYIEQQLKPLKEQGLKIKTTRLGRGLSSGAELEYADEDTLRNALEGRK